MKYNTYIFDFNYTLADATSGIVSCTNHALNALNFAGIQREEIRKTVGLTLKETFPALTGISDEILAARFASLFKEKANKVMTASMTLSSDTTETLAQLNAAGHKTAIVSNKYHFSIEDALNKFVADKSGILYIGESLIGAKTAVKASVDVAAVTTGTISGPDFETLPNVLEPLFKNA